MLERGARSANIDGCMGAAKRAEEKIDAGVFAEGGARTLSFSLLLLLLLLLGCTRTRLEEKGT